jgi:hypothetical protein
MKTLLYIILLSFSLYGFVLPPNNSCDSPSAIAELNVNNVKAKVLTGGDLWWDRSNGSYNVPKDDPNGVSALFAGGLWIAGVDPGGNLKIAAQTYGAANGSNEFWAGPLDPNTGTTDFDLCGNFDRFWEVDITEINAHIEDFNDNGVIDDPIPVSIRSWPGRENPNFSQLFGWTLPSQRLAPFVDINGDGIYNPMDGDYPKIKGDHAIWWVMNDEGGGNMHPGTQGQPIQIEIHAMAYACSSPGTAMDNTTFYEFTYINRAFEDLNDTQISLWVDPDLGCYLDDFMGSNPENKMAIVYNQDSVDGEPGSDCPGGVPSYGSDIPMLGIKVLDGAYNHLGQDVGFSSFMSFTSGANGPPSTSDPNIAAEYYNYMRGVWRDGTPLTQGGTGYNPGSIDIVSHAFPDSPNDPNGWSMCTENLPALDRRILINSGPFNLSAQGGEATITYAVVTQLSVDYPCPNYETLLQLGEEIEGTCDGITPVQSIKIDQTNISVIPNPMNDFSKVKIDGENELISELEVFNSNGTLVSTYSNVNSSEITINKNGLPSGVYYLKILTKSNQFFSKRIVIL